MSETQTHDLVVFSAYGRGQWIATELSGRGWNVALIDLTNTLRSTGLPSNENEDVEGPFGLFESQGLLASQRTFLADQGDFETLPSGFSVWLPKGPFEFRGELTAFHVRSHEIPDEVETYLRRAGIDPKESDRERRKLARLQYSYSWLSLFAHSLTSSEHRENHVALEGEAFAPLFSPYSVRQLTDEGIKKALHLCEVSGVKVSKEIRSEDLSEIWKDGRSVQAIGRPGADKRARAFVWSLSYEETKLISDTFASRLFGQPWPEAQWAWERLRYEVDQTDILNHLPLSTVLIEDVDLAWTRANMVLLRRKRGGSALDAWIKIPTWMLRERKVLTDVANDVKSLIESRCPGVRLTLKSADSDLAASQLKKRPPLWPVYSESERSAIESSASSLRATNLFFNSPGLWKTMDWLGRFHHESEIVAKLEKLKSQWDAAQRKADAADEKRRQRSAQQ